MNEPTLEAVQAALGNQTNRRGHRVFSAEGRSMATRYAKGRIATGATVSQVSAELGLEGKCIPRWLQGTKQGQLSRGGFTEVQVKAASLRQEGPVVHGPLGIRIEGLGLGEVAELLRRVSCLA